MRAGGKAGPVVYPIAAISAAAIVLAVYHPVLRLGFLSDDYVLVERLDRGGPFGVWSRDPTWFFRPLAALVLFAQLRLGGEQPWLFHATSLALHAVDGLLVFVLARTLLGAGAGAVPWLAVVLFLALPSRAEPVAWISSQPDLLATGLATGALLLFLRARSGATMGVAACLFALALLAKVSVLMLAPIVAGWAGWRRQEMAPRDRRRAMLGAIGFGLAVAVYFLLCRLCTGAIVAGYGPQTHLHLDLPVAARNVVTLLVATAAPRTPWPIVAIGAIALGGAVAIWGRRRDASAATVAAATAIGWLASLLPAINLGIVSLPGHAENERYAYWPAVFGSLAIASGVGALLPARRTGPLLAAAVLVALAFPLRSVLRDWERADRVARAALASIEAGLPARRLNLMAVPDSVRGAFVFREGIAAAIRRHWGERAPEEVRILGRVTLTGASETFPLAREGDGYRLVVPATLPVPRVGGAEELPPGAMLVRRSADIWEIGLPPREADARTLYFDGGRFRPAP